MSFLITQPELLAAAAAKLEGIGWAISAANLTAALLTTGVVPAAADQVSAVTAARFAGYAQMYQAIQHEAGAIREQFANTMGISANSYTAAEAANATQAAGGYLMPVTTPGSAGLSGLVPAPAIHAMPAPAVHAMPAPAVHAPAPAVHAPAPAVQPASGISSANH